MGHERRLVRGVDRAQFPAPRASHVRRLGVETVSGHHDTLAGAALRLVRGDNIAVSPLLECGRHRDAFPRVERAVRLDCFYCEYLPIAGTSPRIAMEIMRHSDIKLTTKTYTDAGLLPLAETVINLPSLTKPAKPSAPDSQIDSQRLFRASTDLSSQVTRSTKEHYLELPSIEGDSHENSELVTTCPENQEKLPR